MILAIILIIVLISLIIMHVLTVMAMPALLISYLPLSLCVLIGIIFRIVYSVKISSAERVVSLERWLSEKNVLEKARKEDLAAQAEYDAQNKAYAEKHVAHYRALLAQKEQELATRRAAFSSVSVFQTSGGSAYLARLIRLMEEGRANTVTDAINIAHNEDSQRAQREIDRMHREAREREADAARAEFENQLNLIRAEERRKADELERIRRDLENR